MVLVIPTHNRPDDLSKTIERSLPLLGHELGLVVVDDASTDPRQMEVLNDIENLGDWARVIRLKAWHGCTRARKSVLDELNCEYVIILDDDSYFAHASLEILRLIRERFEAEPELAVQAFPVLVPDQQEVGVVRRNWYEEGRLTGRFVNCACAFRMDAYRRSGGYRSEFDRPYGEERDLAIRLIDQGWVVRQYEGPWVIHHVSPSSRNSIQNMSGQTLNSLRFVWWYHPTWMAVPYTMVMIAKFVLKALKSSLPVRGIILGIRDFLAQIRRLKRRPVRSETLKIFHGIQHQCTYTKDEMQQLAGSSWVRTFKFVLLGRITWNWLR